MLLRMLSRKTLQGELSSWTALARRRLEHKDFLSGALQRTGVPAGTKSSRATSGQSSLGRLLHFWRAVDAEFIREHRDMLYLLIERCSPPAAY